MDEDDDLGKEFAALGEKMTEIAVPGMAAMALMVALIDLLRSKKIVSEREIEGLIDAAKGSAGLKLGSPYGEDFLRSVRASIDLFAVAVRETANTRPN